MLLNHDDMSPESLERIATNTLNEAHELATTASDIVQATCAQALATIGAGQATLAASAWATVY